MQDLLLQIRTFLEQQQETYGNIRIRVPDTRKDQPEENPHSELRSDSITMPDEPRKELSEEVVVVPESRLVSLQNTPYGRIHELIPSNHPVVGLAELAEVERFVANNTLIPIDEIRTKPVFGVGNPTAELMVIGEAPGRDEDLQGEPFVGKAGQLLDKILKAIGFSRRDVYIANILKSRPPGNRNPEPDEIEKHIPVLYKQIALIQPKIILCLGKVSAGTLLSSADSLSRMRQTEHDFYGIPLMVTYHPAALLRNPQWKRATWEDVQRLRTRYDQLVST